MLKVYFQTYWRHRVSKPVFSHVFFFFFYKELKVQILNQKCIRKFVCIWQIRRHHTCLIKHKTQISEQSLHSFSLIFFFFFVKVQTRPVHTLPLLRRQFHCIMNTIEYNLWSKKEWDTSSLGRTFFLNKYYHEIFTFYFGHPLCTRMNGLAQLFKRRLAILGLGFRKLSKDLS